MLCKAQRSCSEQKKDKIKSKLKGEPINCGQKAESRKIRKNKINEQVQCSFMTQTIFFDFSLQLFSLFFCVFRSRLTIIYQVAGYR